MSAPRRSGRRSRLAVPAALALVAIPGFGLGVLGGLLWEEPALVAAYFLGGTQAVALGGSAPDADPAPEEPLPAVAAAPASAPVARAPARPPAPPAAGGGHVAVQVGAFAERAGAERLAASLERKGYAVYVVAGESGGAARWRVRVGPLGSREAGEREAAKLKREERLPTWVLEEDR